MDIYISYIHIKDNHTSNDIWLTSTIKSKDVFLSITRNKTNDDRSARNTTMKRQQYLIKCFLKNKYNIVISTFHTNLTKKKCHGTLWVPKIWVPKFVKFDRQFKHVDGKIYNYK